MSIVDEIYQVVSRAVKTRWRELERRKKNEFAKGDRVSFDKKDGTTVTGTVHKHLQKKVRVITDDNFTWTVSPSLLTRAANDE